MLNGPSANLKDARSYDVVFVPFCLLCRGVVAEGLVKEYTSVVQPIVVELIRRNINLVQMPCPELHLGGFDKGLKRKPKLKTEYETNEFRDICRLLSSKTADLISAMHLQSYNIKCVLGIEYSPSCAVNYVYRSHSSSYSSNGYTSHEPGIFMEELKTVLKLRGVAVPFIGVHLRGMNKTLESLKEILGLPIGDHQPALF